MPEYNPYIQQQAQGLAAQDAIASLLRGPQMQRAQAMQDYQMAPLSGGGYATPSPTIFDAAAQIATNYRGRQKQNELEAQATALRGDVMQGRMAEMQGKESKEDQRFRNQMALQQARLDDQRRRDEERYARQDQERQLVQMVSPTGEPMNVQVDRQGRGYLMGDEIPDFDQWRTGKKTGLKPTGTQVQNYRESLRLLGESKNLLNQLFSMPDAAYQELNRPALDAAISMIPINAVERLAESAAYDTEEAKSYKTQAARFESRLSQLASGMQVTGFEMSDRQRWSPHAPGINAAERQRRIAHMEREFQKRIQTYEQFFPEYTMSAMGAQGQAQPQAYTPQDAGDAITRAVSNLPAQGDIAAKRARLEELRAKKAKAGN